MIISMSPLQSGHFYYLSFISYKHLIQNPVCPQGTITYYLMIFSSMQIKQTIFWNYYCYFGFWYYYDYGSSYYGSFNIFYFYNCYG